MNKKIKVLQVNKLYYPWIGGIEKVVQDIAEGLCDRVDMKVLVCNSNIKTEIHTINKVKVIKSGSIGTYFSMPVSFSFFRHFKKLSDAADIIHLHMPFPLGDLACFLSNYKGKIILWWHSDVVKQKRIMMFYKPLMNWLLNRANLIIVATESHINSSSYLKPFRKKCKVIPYGIDIKKYDIVENKNKNFLKLQDPSNKKILFVGRLVYYKGVDILIEAFKNLTGCELFIIGKGNLLSKLKSQVKKLNLSNDVHFIGNLNSQDLKTAFCECDIFVLPSIANSEAFGLVQLEAMAYGKPVINTYLPTGVPYVSLNNISGLTVEPGNPKELAKAIQRLVDDDALRSKFALNAYNRARDIFNLNKMLDDIYEHYKK